MQWIPDKANICLRCAHGEVKASDAKTLPHCECTKESVHGANKGCRFNCKHYEPKKEE